jgi:chaperonin GroES
MKFRPLHDRILVKRIEAEEKTKGGIIIPETGKEKPGEAMVIAVGPGRMKDDGKRIEMDIKKGDRIVISKWGGNEIKLNGEEHLILKEDEVLGIIEK